MYLKNESSKMTKVSEALCFRNLHYVLTLSDLLKENIRRAT